MLETSNFTRKYTHIVVSENIPFTTDVSIFFFFKKSAFLVQNSVFTQSNSVRAVLEIL